jgi:hypothetical protein
MTVTIGRRELLAALGGAAAWPLVARAQQPAMPVIGYLNFGSPEYDAPRLTGLRRGLNETGYVEGRNYVIEYRWPGNQADRLPARSAMAWTTSIRDGGGNEQATPRGRHGRNRIAGGALPEIPSPSSTESRRGRERTEILRGTLAAEGNG